MKQVKVCGMKYGKNIQEIATLSIDYMGFIFYPLSKRYVDYLDNTVLDCIPSAIKKVGVFVNASRSEIHDKIAHYQLDCIQLHGEESPQECQYFSEQGVAVIKAFAITEAFDFKQTKPFEKHCSLFVFDTACKEYGGSGKSFDWKILQSYQGNTPFLLSGGIGIDNIQEALEVQHPLLKGYDLNSQLEEAYAIKDYNKTRSITNTIKMKHFNPDEKGYYGEYGGSFIPEMLYKNVSDLQEKYLSIIQTEDFQQELNKLLKDYVGRPTPLFYSANLSAKYKAKIYLKREDLNHTGAHKINNTIGQVLLAKRLGKKRIIAETGAGQHGVATATTCALLNLECTVFMGAHDIERQKPNVERMRMLGAKVVAAESGSKTLKDATNEAIREWINNPQETYYVIGSVVGPHPYPDMVAKFQSIISKEIKAQLIEQENTPNPNYVIACVGGGSNAMGAFYHFIDNGHTKLIAVEAAGKGVETGQTAATIALGKQGIIHGSKTYLIQTEDGQIIEPYSISAGLDYPGIGPAHAYLSDTGKITVGSITDGEAIKAAFELTRIDGIIPALESAHALAYLDKMKLKESDIVVVNLSGRGDKDMITYSKYFNDEQ